MYNHIVVATDGSLHANKALQEAVRLAKGSSAQLTLVYIADLNVTGLDGAGFIAPTDLHDTAFEQGKALLETAKQQAQQAGVTNVTTHIGESWEGSKDMARVLVRYSQAHGGDLLVMGTHGRTGLSHLLMGSFAEEVLRQTECPLLIVRTDA